MITILVHTANIAFLASYATKNARALRWLTIIGSVFLFPYYLTQALWIPATWGVIFLAINVWRLQNSKE
jgi:hypothetical protein